MVDKKIKKIIDNSLQNNLLNHCYLLNAESKANIDDSILYIINKINNLELKELDKDKLPLSIYYLDDELSKEKILEILKASSLSTFEGVNKKIIIIKNIENASVNALNSLLKTIEEPSNNVCFILTTNNKSKVLSTIISRSIVFDIKPILQQDLENILFQKNKFSKKESWFFSNIFVDETEVEKMLQNFNYSYVEELLNVVEKSFKNKYLLYIYLCKFTKKDQKNVFICLVKSLSFILSWKEKNISFNDSKLNKFIEKLKSSNIDYFECFKAINDFINSTETAQNYFLQAERMLIKIMENYD